ncbi:MAG: malate synthase A [Herpetosiphon sp.]
MDSAIQITGPVSTAQKEILTPEALAFVAELQRRFNGTREQLLTRRQERQAEIDGGKLPDFLPETAEIRESQWQVAPAPRDLQKRHVEITGPTERKMMINALNSGADIFMVDFEDSLSPTWENVVDGQINLRDAIRRKIEFTNPDGRVYRLNATVATMVVRPRGWHLVEKHALLDGQPVSASLWDFGLYFYHNARELLARGSGPYFYLPKMESHLEARLWNDVFTAAQDALNVPRGTIRATVLIETILAAFEMDEILYELREHAAGHNAGRWDYIFSMIKKLRNRPEFMLPDRSQVTMAVPFMRMYAQLLVKTCHRRGAHAIGGMAAFIPNRRDQQVTDIALAKVREDKEREAKDGFDGTWVAHPDLVPTAKEIFDRVLGDKPHQKEKLRDDVQVSGRQLIDTKIEGSTITEAGMRNNISVALQYIDAWLAGNGAVAIYNLMEDAATAEISRAQIWQWINHHAKLDTGEQVTAALYSKLKEEEVAKLQQSSPGHIQEAARLLDEVALKPQFIDFLTLPAYATLA